MTFRTVLFWLAAACCVVAELAILRSVFFGRAAYTPAQAGIGASTPTRRASEIAWVLLPAVGLLFILYITWRAVDPAPVPVRDVSHSGATIGA